MAAAAAVMFVRHPALHERRPEIVAFHQQSARVAVDRPEAASYVIGLGVNSAPNQKPGCRIRGTRCGYVPLLRPPLLMTSPPPRC
jgi:hypothetical protein